MPGPLIVAVGGGGDAITSCLLTGVLGAEAPVPVMTYAWERLLVDPLPGPRTADDFTGLDTLAPGVLEVRPATRPVPPAGSSLPRLAAELPVRLFLLDPTGGAVGMAQQMIATAEQLGRDRLVVVDVGGDILTDGTDPGLRSPLADQLALGAALRTGLPLDLVVAGAGLDGELTPEATAARLVAWGSTVLPPVTPDAMAGVRGVFAWHPSEASGLFAAAARGARGRVQVRDAGDVVILDDATARLHLIRGEAIGAESPAHRMQDTASLDEAGDRVRELCRGVNELDYETSKAARRAAQGAATHLRLDSEVLDTALAGADAAGADYLSLRRLAELAGAITAQVYEQLVAQLTRHLGERVTPPLVAVRPRP